MKYNVCYHTEYWKYFIEYITLTLNFVCYANRFIKKSNFTNARLPRNKIL